MSEKYFERGVFEVLVGAMSVFGGRGKALA